MTLRPDHRARRAPRDGGFSLIELLAVLTVGAILAGVALPTLSRLASTRTAAAGRLIVRDLSYARERAITSGQRTWVTFSIVGNSYSLLQEPAGSPGKANAVAVSDIATRKSFVQTFGTNEFRGVTLASASFGAGADVGFDWLGKPLNNAQTPLANSGIVVITGGPTITVQVETGLPSMP